MIENFVGIDKRLTERLNDLGLKQIDVYHSTGISKNAMSNYVTGKRVPDTLSIYKLSKALSVSIEWLLTGVEQSSIIRESSSKESQIIDRLRGLSDDDLTRVIGYLDALSFMEKEHKGKKTLYETKHGKDAAANNGA